jgi:hypothetical protein
MMRYFGNQAMISDPTGELVNLIEPHRIDMRQDIARL